MEVSSTKIFGIRPVMEAMQADKSIDKIMLRDGIKTELIQLILDAAHNRNIPIQWVPTERLERLAKGRNHQGVIAFFAAADYANLEDILENLKEEGTVASILILDQITDVRNFGAIVRTAECAGVHAVVVAAKGAAPLSADAMKTSSGALNYVPICKVPNMKTALFLLKSYDIQIIAATEKATKNYYQVDFKQSTALILGSEGTGITKSNLDLADDAVKIPLQGEIDSLNVSAAAAILLFEGVRQRS